MENMPAKRFVVTITEITPEWTITKREWVQGGPVSPSSGGDWGYTPQASEIRVIEREIYKQSFSALNVFGLVEAAMRDAEP